MNIFDHKIISTNGVYYYARFVDDIIIFSYEKLETTAEMNYKVYMISMIVFAGLSIKNINRRNRTDI